MNDRESHATRGIGSILRTRTAEESDEFHRSLWSLFEEVETWQELISESLPVAPTSSLGIADGLTAPFQTSQTIGYLRLTAVDHLHALRTLMKEAQAQHIFAPYSLIRASIESAATALWIMSDSVPESMAFRTLQLEMANLHDRKRAYTAIGASDQSHVSLGQDFECVLTQNKLKRSDLKTRPGALKTIQEVSSTFRLRKLPAVMWQMCSAATHGRKWVTGILTMMDAQDDGASEIISGKLTSDEQGILLATYSACRLLRPLFEVQARLSKPEGHSGESFMKPASRLILPTTGLLVPKHFSS